MAKLWFQNNNGEERVIAEVNNFDDVYKEIDKFIDRCNEGRPENKQFKIYYTRIYEENGRTKLDVGSWSEFFYTDLEYEVQRNDS